jgi:hypothetical protein
MWKNKYLLQKKFGGGWRGGLRTDQQQHNIHFFNCKFEVEQKIKSMKLQIVQDAKGNNTGVFIPIEDWKIIKSNYPDVDELNTSIPIWQQQILNNRLQSIADNPDNLRPIDELFKELDSDL